MALPVLAVLLICIIVNVRPLYSKMQFAIDRMNRTIQENLTAVRVVKAYVRGDYEIAKFEEANLNLKKNPKSIWHCRVKYACHAVCYVRNNTVTAVIRRLSDS